MAFIDVTPIIPNTTMQDSDTTGSHKITPITGYAIHNKDWDRIVYDNNGNIISKTLGFRTSGTTCPATYDFAPHELTLENGETVIVYGVKEYFTVLVEDLPEEGIIYGGGTKPKPEIM